MRVIVIHTQSPTVHHGDWLADLEKLATVSADGPTVMTGDFNASWWHPEFRAVLGTTWRDAHIAMGGSPRATHFALSSSSTLS